MSSNKNKLIVRMLLTIEGAQPGEIWKSIAINCEGGLGSKNPVILELVRRGFLRKPLSRGTPVKKFGEGKFRSFFGPYGIHGHAPRLCYIVTEKGRKFYEDNMHLIKPEMREPHWSLLPVHYWNIKKLHRKNSVYWG